jgi:hypothetical protein
MTEEIGDSDPLETQDWRESLGSVLELRVRSGRTAAECNDRLGRSGEPQRSNAEGRQQ